MTNRPDLPFGDYKLVAHLDDVEVCKWSCTDTDDEPGAYGTNCGNLFYFSEDGIK